MRRSLACLTLAVSCSAGVSSSSAAPHEAVARCATGKLAFALSEPSPPTQSGAIGLDVRNTSSTACRLALPISLTLTRRSGERLRVEPQTSRLTLLARALRPRTRAYVIWTYANYCGSHDSRRPVVYTISSAGRTLRGRGGAPPCNVPRRPVSLDVLFVCPHARGPAIRPRPHPLCPPP